MNHDDKLTSGTDETPPDTEAEELAAKDDTAERGGRGRSTERVGNTIVFSKAAQAPQSTRLDSNFGMPDFGFPPHEVEPPVDRAPPPPPPFIPEPAFVDDALKAAKTGLEKPLREDTGWASTSSIERPQSAQFDSETPEDADAQDAEEAAEQVIVQRTQATVMPFPGHTVQRSHEPMPSDILRGGTEPREAEIAAQTFAEPVEAAPDFDVAAQDTLADAVQSALRNVYGGQTAAREEEAPDLSGYTVAESLRHAAAADQTGHEDVWPEQANGWHEERAESFQEAERNADNIEATTDSVLDYLYGQRRGGDRREGTVLSANSSLRDFGEAAGFNEEWQENPEFDDRSQPPGALRDFGGMTYPGAQPTRYPQPSGERPYARDAGRDTGAYHPDPRTTEWERPSYLSNTEARFPRGQYPAPLPASSSESLSAGSPDSGHLLGAAGLGLIGGIALAGVLAVFVFNSFVDEGDQTVADGPTKVIERLGSTAPETPRSVSRETQAAPEPAPQRVAAAPAEPAVPDRSTSRPAPQVSLAPDQKLYAGDVTGSAGSPIPLDIKLGSSANGEDTLISLKGLPPEARLSTGIDVGGGQWLLPPSKLKDLTVTMPQGATGSFNLEVQLLKDDAQTSLSEPIPFGLTIGPRGAKTLGAGGRAAPKGEESARLAVLPDETPQIETDVLTQLLIRDGNKLMRDGDIAGARRLYEQAAANGNPEAALAMGRSFDPSYFEKLPVKTGKPDPATAFEWYKKALEGGLVTARVKIDGLKQWLQR